MPALCNGHVRQARTGFYRLKLAVQHLPFARQRRVTFSTMSVVKDWSVRVRAFH
jgi:hypothetical protein